MNILRIIRWLCGYVTVRLKGNNAASFLNFCLQKKITVWSVIKDNNDILLNMSLSDYKNIRSIRREFKNSINISHASFIGLPKKALIINKRKSLAVGVAVFLSVIFAFSQFIWQIEIVGNKNISNKQIEEAYMSLGVYNGMPRSELDSYALRDRLPLKIREVSWCSFNLEGTRLTINITEVNEYDKTGKNEYSNLIAKCDGIVEKIEVISGNKVAKVGSVVKKGDLLVSGAPELNSQQFTYSEGKIFAKTGKTFNISIPKIKTEKARTGKIEERDVADIFGFKIPLYLDNIHYNYESEFFEYKLSFFGGQLPIKIIKRRFFEVDYIGRVQNDEDIINDARASLLEEVKKHDIIELEVLSQSIVEKESEYQVTFECRCNENIATTEKINVAS